MVGERLKGERFEKFMRWLESKDPAEEVGIGYGEWLPERDYDTLCPMGRYYHENVDEREVPLDDEDWFPAEGAIMGLVDGTVREEEPITAGQLLTVLREAIANARA